jgi:hypothetical protein
MYVHVYTTGMWSGFPEMTGASESESGRTAAARERVVGAWDKLSASEWVNISFLFFNGSVGLRVGMDTGSLSTVMTSSFLIPKPQLTQL